MEVSLRTSDDGVVVVKEDNRVESNGCCDKEIIHTDNQLESAKAEMGEAREENRRLRMHLNQIMKDYQTLQMQFHDIVGRGATKESTNTTRTSHQETEEPEFVSLSLGRTSSDSRKDIEKPSKGKEDLEDKQGLALGLDCKFEVPKTTPIETSLKLSPENSSNEVKDEAGETWPPPKGVKTMRSGDDEEVLLGNSVKKARVSVRIRCDTPTMNDGCQWRKYGQKIAKGNPCPRAYYRCTVAPSCPVRKQVQRCAEDMSILITTYEGTHNHPLAISATAMASTTSAAASMLSSGSSSTTGSPSTAITASTTSALRGLNFYLSDNPKSNQFVFPYSSISSSPSYPTITLDLTSSSSSSHFSKISSSFLSTPRYSSTNLNFNSWNNNTGVLNYGTQSQLYNKNNQFGSLSFSRQQTQEIFNQSFMQKSNPNPSYPINPNPSQQQPLPADSIAAATKAITSDPNFQSALAAALTSIIGGSGNGSGNDSGGAKTLGSQGQNLNLGESFPGVSNFPSIVPSATNKCYSTPSLLFSTSKSKSTSPSNGD
ncbi:probable WRKY transcription factor 61 [Camellia sinensis]|uniref:WRKY domain-containing protein n=1 Tax=Camellia sinensis var. sinensis TaxID=542762 RepID=A0A4S4EZM5_CAMSN|nr:probable WRKY transcription factor 61 [Camellia sinensis]THG22590.1 hypothetical protein TEA_013599 [Camellia sinensis var. sinensis]